MQRIQEKGFTLLELMVVLVIMGYASSYVGPRLWQTYIKSTEKSTLQNFANALQKKRINSRINGTAIRFSGKDNDNEKLPPLPAGWQIESASTIIFLPNGVTNGGSIRVRSASEHLWLIRLTPLDGKITIERQ